MLIENNDSVMKNLLRLLTPILSLVLAVISISVINFLNFSSLIFGGAFKIHQDPYIYDNTAKKELGLFCGTHSIYAIIRIFHGPHIN